MTTLRTFAALALLCGCIGTSPEEQERNALGGDGEGEGEGEEDEGGPEHNPGLPCLVCHEQFAIAGTVYLHASDSRGLAGAEVTMRDDEGHEFAVTTNRAGNFMVYVKSSLSAPVQRGRGRVSVPWAPSFPLAARVDYEGNDQRMASFIWREGSCSACHGPTPGADSVGRVYAVEEGL